MKVLIIGAAGMIGRKLAERLADAPTVLGSELEQLTLADVVSPSAPAKLAPISQCLATDLSQPAAAETLIEGRPDLIIHLAAVVSGEAEADFDKGYAINLDGTRALLDAIRAEGLKQPYLPRVVFASSIAVFGAPFPAQIEDDYFTTPLTSYGTQKSISELLIADYSRRGILDGLSLRLPTICVRPGTPNAAASGFFSNIIREPLVGQEAILPVSETVRHWFASPQAAVGFFTHAATLDTQEVGPRRSITLPGLSATVGEQIQALEAVAGPKASALIRREPDPTIDAIVAGWPQNFAPKRALSLGFKAENSFEQIIRAHVENELS